MKRVGVKYIWRKNQGSYRCNYEYDEFQRRKNYRLTARSF